MLHVSDLCKDFGTRRVVKNLNLKIDRELFVFLGPNGAGKTTSIKMMTGLLQPTQGSVSVNGVDLHRQPLKAKRLMGLVPEEPALYEKLTPREFVLFMARLYKIEAEDAERRMQQLFDIFELTERSYDLIEEFSHGMKQKVAITAALVHDPQILFLDEPTTGLDPKAARNLKDLLRGLIERGTTIFMSTHILEVAERMCDRVGIINNGELIALGTMDELSKKAGYTNLEDIFLELTGSGSMDGVKKFLRDS